MIANWLKILLFAAGGTTAAAGTAYYTGIYDPWASHGTGSPVASAPDPARPQEDQAVPDETADAPVAEAFRAPAIAALPEGGDPAATNGSARAQSLAVPSFHVVRVEPNGSMVIAGSAEPNSEIEVVAGANVIARADVGPSGDFAAILDDALDPGDYQIVLRSTGPGEGLVTTSVETAIVSIPDDASGQVLALVEEPGAASRLITVPEGEVLTDDPDAGSESEIAALDQGSDTDRAAATPGGDDAASDSEAGSDDETEIAARSEAQGEETQARPATPRSALAVEAIEIEGRSVYVAGRGSVGTTVRVYANDILLGEARVSDAGRFLIETQTDLPVGDYIVRTDVIGPGGEVTARAAVPFQREPGEAIAAVAPREPAPDTAATPQNPTSGIASEPSAISNVQTQAGTTTDAASQATESVAAASSPELDEALSPGLQSVDGSVIIRRGDTLWRISRRVYGRGVRYSTIYLANQDQIRNPDRIWPGQIFAVPEETEEGEKADMSTVSDQIAPRTSTE